MRYKSIFPMSLIVSLLILNGCSRDKEEAKSMEQIYAESGVPVRIQPVRKSSFTTEHTFHSVLTGIKESTAHAMVNDKIDQVLFKVGNPVEKEAVVVMFPTDNPSAQYFQAKVSFEHATASLQRMENLYQSGGISLQELDNVRTQYRVAKANWEGVEQSIKVKAPISGTITQINVLESDNVEPGDPLFTISQTHCMKAKLWATENQIQDIQIGAKATASWQNIILMGKVTQVDMSLNSDKQAFGFVAEFENHEKRVMSGVNAEIKIMTFDQEESVVIDRKNIVREGDGYYVYVLKNNQAEKREVHLGRMSGLDVEILDGLEPGDQLIIEGQMLLTDGKKVKIITGTQE